MTLLIGHPCIPLVLMLHIRLIPVVAQVALRDFLPILSNHRLGAGFFYFLTARSAILCMGKILIVLRSILPVVLVLLATPALVVLAKVVDMFRVKLTAFAPVSFLIVITHVLRLRGLLGRCHRVSTV